MERDEQLTKLLKESRMKAGLTQSEVAKKLGYATAQFISNWERGLSSPPLKIIKTLAQLYGISMDHLFETLLEFSKAELEKNMRREFKNLKKA